MISSILQDLRFGARSLLRSPLFTLAALLTLALGIGANTAIFSVVNGVLLQPLPFPEPDRLVRIYSAYPERDIWRGTASEPDFLDWRDQSDAFVGMTAFPNLSLSGFVLTGNDRPDRIQAHYVAPGFFETMGTAPLLGRTIGPNDVREGANAVVVLSFRSWQERFGGEPGIVGSTIALSDSPYTVIGVMPRSFAYPSRDAEIWVPLSLIPESGIPRLRQVRFLAVVGRLAPGVTIDEAQASLATVTRRLSEEYPDSNGQLTDVRLVPLHEQMTGDSQRGLLALLGAVGAVLMICCANVANLMLVRAQARARELAVRAALGASRKRLARQLVTESVLLAGVGGTLGIGVAALSLRLLLRLAPADLPRIEQIAIDPVVIGFALLVSVATGLLFGLAPAWRTWRGDLIGELRVAGGGSDGDRRSRARSALVLAEAALVMVLVVGAGLLLRSLDNLLHIDPGFDVEGAVSMKVSAPGYRLAESEEVSQFFGEVLAEVRRVPGVRAAGLVRPMPLSPDTFQGEDFRFTVEGQEAPPEGQEPEAVLRFASDEVFQALGVPLLAGRDFGPEDDRSVGVLRGVVNQALAERHFPGESAVGRFLRAGGSRIEIVGVVGDIRQTGLIEETANVIYAPLAQVTRSGMTLVVRTEGSPRGRLGAIQEAIWKVNPDQPIEDIATLDTLVRQSVTAQRYSTWMVGTFAVLALLLAAVGIYGVVAHTVAQRGREIGIRMALGARGGDVVRWVVAQGLAWVAAGVAVGALVAAALGRLIASMLHDVGSNDPLVYATAAAVLLAVALAASLLPAWRAVSVDPVRSLRAD
jgi:predicted permease